MHRIALFLARTAVTAWVGAAVLFVVVGVAEVVYPGFGSEIRDQLVVIRFPWYYRFGIALMGTGFVGTLGAASEFPPLRRRIVAGLLATALVVFVAEHFLIYVRLAEMVTPPGQPRTVEFMLYHKLSMWINFADLALCLAATGLLNWPAKGG
jgi:hypothetical protein